MEERELYETKIRTNLEGWKVFKESGVWKDIQQELKIWLNIALSGYDRCSKMEEVAKLNGVREAIMNMLVLPDKLIEGIELAAKTEDKKAEKETM